MQPQPLKASNFSLKSGLPLFNEKHNLKYPKDHPKSPLYLQTGDPKKFGYNNVNVPPRAYEILKTQVLCQTNHGYGASNGLKPIRQAVAGAFSGENIKLTEDDVVLCNGGGLALMQIMKSIVNKGDNILIPSIGFPYYQGFSEALDFELRGYKLLPERNWEIDLKDLESKIDKSTKFIYIINPSNPCGSVFSKEHILEILSVCSRNKVLVVADEIYWNMVYPKTEFYPIGQLTDDVPVITMMGLDKAFLVPGWTLGWLIIYDKNKVFTKVKEGLLAISQIYLHPTTFIQHALPGLLSEIGLEFVKKEIMPLFEKNRDQMLEELKLIKGLRAIKPNGSMFMAVIIELDHFKEYKNDKEFLQALLDEENISAFPLSAFTYDLPEIQGFRLLTCATESFYSEYFQRMKCFCEKHFS